MNFRNEKSQRVKKNHLTLNTIPVNKITKSFILAGLLASSCLIHPAMAQSNYLSIGTAGGEGGVGQNGGNGVDGIDGEQGTIGTSANFGDSAINTPSAGKSGSSVANGQTGSSAKSGVAGQKQGYSTNNISGISAISVGGDGGKGGNGGDAGANGLAGHGGDGNTGGAGSRGGNGGNGGLGGSGGNGSDGTMTTSGIVPSNKGQDGHVGGQGTDGEKGSGNVDVSAGSPGIFQQGTTTGNQNGGAGGAGGAGAYGGNGDNGSNGGAASAGGNGSSGGQGGAGGHGLVGNDGGLGQLTIDNAQGNVGTISLGGAGGQAGIAGKSASGSAGGDGGQGGQGGDGGVGGNGGLGGDGGNGGAGGNGADADPITTSAGYGGGGGAGGAGGAGGTGGIGGNGGVGSRGGNGASGIDGLQGGHAGNGGNAGNAMLQINSSEISGTELTVGGKGGNASSASDGANGGAGGKGGDGGDSGNDGASGQIGVSGISGTDGKDGTKGIDYPPHNGGSSGQGGRGGSGGNQGDAGQGGIAGIGGIGGDAANGGKGGHGANGGLGGNGGSATLTLNHTSLKLAESVTVGADAGNGSDGATGGNGGNGGDAGATTAKGINGGIGGNGGQGGDGGIGADGGTGGSGKVVLNDSYLSANSLNIGADGGWGGNGGDSGRMGLDGKSSSAIQAGVLASGGNGGHAGNAGNAGTGSVELKNSELKITSSITLGGNGGNGGNGGLLKQANATAGNGGHGSAGASGSLLLENSIINNSGDMILGGIGGIGGDNNDATGGLAGNAGDGSVVLRNSAGTLAHNIFLGNKGGNNSRKVAHQDSGLGGNGSLSIESGDYDADTLSMSSVTTNSSSEGQNNAGNGHLTMSGGTFNLDSISMGAGTENLNIKNGAGASLNLQNGILATKVFHGTSGRLNINGADAALLHGTRNTGWKHWQDARDWLENETDFKANGILGLAGGETLDLSSQNLNWNIGNGRVTSKSTSLMSGLGSQSLTLVDAKALSISGKTGLVIGDGTIDSSAKLLVIADDNLKVADKMDLLEANDGSQTWSADNIQTTSRLVDTGLNYDASRGKLVGTMGNSNIMHNLPGITRKTADMLKSMAETIGVNTASTNKTQQFLSRAADKRFITRGKDGAKIIESAINLSSIAGIQRIANNILTAASTAIQYHLVTASTKITQKDRDSVWVTPMYGNDRFSSYSMGNNDTKTTINYGGLMVGSDHLFNHRIIGGDVRVGLAADAGTGRGNSGATVLSTRNNFNYWGMSGYSSWTRNKLKLMADISYSHTRNEIKQDLPSSMRMGEIKGNTNTDILSIGLRSEYKFNTQYVDITPYLGVKYSYLNTDGFSINSEGQKLFSNGKNHQQLVSIPVGVNFSRTFVQSYGIKITPYAGLGYIGNIGDTWAHNKVALQGMEALFSSDSRIVDRSVFEGRIGVDLQHKNSQYGLGTVMQSSTNDHNYGVMATYSLNF